MRRHSDLYALRVLLGFEARQARRRALAILRSPLRLIGWLGFGAFVVLQSANALRRSTPNAAAAGPAFGDLVAVFIVAGTFGWIGVSLLGLLSAPARFASSAEADFVAMQPFSMRAALLWLLIRASAGRIGDLLRGAVFVLVPLWNVGAVRRGGLLWIGAQVLGIAVRSRLAHAPPAARRLARSAGVAILLLAALVASRRLPALDAIAASSSAPVAWLPVVCIALAVVAALAPSGDVFPELRAVAGPRTSVQTRLERRRAGIAERTFATSPWLELRGPGNWFGVRLASFFRGRGVRTYVLGLAGWFAAGVALPHFGRGASVPAAVVAGPLALCTVAAAALGCRIAVDVRNPLWWYGATPLVARLAVDALAGIWRSALTATVVACGVACGGASELALLALPPFLALLAVARAAAYAVFALLPDRTDLGGPTTLLLLLSASLVATPAALVELSGTIARLPAAATGVLTLAVALATAVPPLAFAAYRFDGRGA